MSEKRRWKMQQAARLLMLGHYTKDVASTLKMRPETLTRWKHTAVYQEEFQKLMDYAEDKIRPMLLQIIIEEIEEMSKTRDSVDRWHRHSNAVKLLKAVKIDLFLAPRMSAKPINPVLKDQEKSV